MMLVCYFRAPCSPHLFSQLCALQRKSHDPACPYYEYNCGGVTTHQAFCVGCLSLSYSHPSDIFYVCNGVLAQMLAYQWQGSS